MKTNRLELKKIIIKKLGGIKGYTKIKVCQETKRRHMGLGQALKT